MRKRLCQLVVSICLIHADVAVAQDREARAPAITPGEPTGLIAEPGPFERVVIFIDRLVANGDTNDGLYPDVSGMPPTAGIAAGVGYRRWANEDTRFIDGSIVLSTTGDRAVQGRIEWPRIATRRLAAGAQARWQHFADLPIYDNSTSRTEPIRRSLDLRTFDTVGYAAVRPTRWMSLDASVGWLATPDASLGPTQGDLAHSTMALNVDTRDFPGHALRGGLYRVARSDFTSRDALTRFTRLEAEATHFIPLAAGRVVVATHGWIASTSAASGETPFYLLPSIGGNNSLRGYAEYRFRDRALLLLNAEARVALLAHLDTVAFVDAGNVALRPSSLDVAHRSYGAGVRVHSRRATFGRLDVARSREGWRVVLKVGDPFNSWRSARRTTMVPFAP